MTDGLMMLPRIGEPETSTPGQRSGGSIAGARQPAGGRSADFPPNIPDTSGPPPVALQEPAHWQYDFDVTTGMSRATFDGVVEFIQGGGTSGPVTSWNGRTGAVVLLPSDLGAAVGGPFLPLTGGALSNILSITGPLGTTDTELTLNGPTNEWAGMSLNYQFGQGAWIPSYMNGIERWEIDMGDGTPETGSNLGSNFAVANFADDGTQIGTPVYIARNTGAVTIATATGTNASMTQLTLDGPGDWWAGVALNYQPGQGAWIPSYRNNVERWEIDMGDGSPETGGDNGSDFTITNFADNGTALGTPLFIKRATGHVTINAGLGAPATTPAPLTVNQATGGGPTLMLNGAAGGWPGINLTYQSGQAAWIGSFDAQGGERWEIDMGDGTPETGGNAGSNFAIASSDDSGNFLATALLIERNSGNTSIQGTLAANGWATRPGLGGAGGSGNYFNFDWNAPDLALWINTTNMGNVSYTSDYRIKRDVEPLPSMWQTVKELRPVSYFHKEFAPPWAGPDQGDAEPRPLVMDDGLERWGFIAHELQETLVKSAATGEKDAEGLLQAPNPWTVIAALTRALQEAMRRIERLEHGE